MNLVSVLIAPAIVHASRSAPTPAPPSASSIALVALAIIVAAIVVSKRRPTAIEDTPAEKKDEPVSNGAA